MSTSAITERNGAAYGRGPQHHNAFITEVGPGTPCGEYMRRYWQPVGVSAAVTSRPKNVRILGEDLILFRDKTGRPGLLYPRCAHRGTSLYYGKVDERGIRCCYHGWLFTVDGTCIEQPCEPEGGRHRDQVRQPWYPVQERYGLVFAYMGPPERTPVLPLYDTMETLGDGEFYFATGGGMNKGQSSIPCNWLQFWENIMDPYHVWVLHSTFSNVQFAEGFKAMPTVEFEYKDHAIVYHAYRNLEDGRKMDRTSTAWLPNVAAVPGVQMEPGRPRQLVWFVPVDDTHWSVFTTMITNQVIDLSKFAMFNGKTWDQLTEEEHQDFPGDYEAQVSQGEISLHSEEHLASSDRGVAMLRRLMTQQIKLVQEGQDPLGVAFEERQAMVTVHSGNFFS